jgi:hypothetical protein
MNFYRCLCLVGAMLLCMPCCGSLIYDVTLDTSGLISNPAAPFAVDFQLNSGDTTTSVVNTASLSMFNFGVGGSAGSGNPFPNSGNASGDLSSTVSLNTNGSFFNEFSQYFVPGLQLSFQLNLSDMIQPSIPDEFSFQLIDGSSTEIPTSDPSGGNSLLLLDITSSAPKVNTFSTIGDGVTITPVVSNVGSQIPEPSTFLLVGLAMVLLPAALRRLKGWNHRPETQAD